MRSRITIPLILFVAVFLNIWFILTLPDWSRYGYNNRLNGIGSLLGICGYLLFSYALFLSSRWSKLESWFGGLDQIYSVHRLIGIIGFCFILIHPCIFALKWIPYNIYKATVFFLPFHRKIAVNLGIYAYWLLILLLGITLLKLLPYDKWKISHKGMTVVYLLASFHFLLSDALFGPTFASQLLLSLPFCLGIASIFYKQFYYSFVKQFPTYVVEKIKKHTENTIEIFLIPEGNPLSFITGQYAFFRFLGPSLSQESHPFTLCGNPAGTHISIIVKARGDYTRAIYQNIDVGYRAYVEGPYGKFDYMKGYHNQIWIAGGIGVVPFLLWAREIAAAKDTTKHIDFFYCVHNKKDALFTEEFLQIQKELPSFHCFFYCSEEKNRLAFYDIEEKTHSFSKSSFFLCGPKRLTKMLTKQLCQKGIERKNISYEDFEFM